jgi:hypothetical protein
MLAGATTEVFDDGSVIAAFRGNGIYKADQLQ